MLAVTDFSKFIPLIASILHKFVIVKKFLGGTSNMYYCTDCKIFIESPKFKRVKRDGKIIHRALCPVCSEELIMSAPEYCRYCGTRLTGNEKDGFCTDNCRRLGKRLWTRELSRRRKIKDDPIARILRMLTSYNNEHKTRYSYGQFVSLILPLLDKKGRNAYGY